MDDIIVIKPYWYNGVFNLNKSAVIPVMLAPKAA
jgi:hypothetical protein